MAAMAARRSQTFIGAKHRARLARKDTAVAITVIARELCLPRLPDGDPFRISPHCDAVAIFPRNVKLSGAPLLHGKTVKGRPPGYVTVPQALTEGPGGRQS